MLNTPLLAQIDRVTQPISGPLRPGPELGCTVALVEMPFVRRRLPLFCGPTTPVLNWLNP